MRIRLLFICLALFSFGYANAKEQGEFPFEKYKLKNDLTVILHNDNSSPIVAVEVWYKVGSKNEPKGKTSLTRFVEYLMFEGSKNLSPGEHLKTIRELGGHCNSGITPDHSEFYQVLPANGLQTALWMEADRMRTLAETLTEKKFQKSKEVLIQQYKNQNLRGMEFQWRDDLFALSYDENYPYHYPVGGYPNDLEKLTSADVLSYLKQYYTPNNAILTISGDFDKNELKHWIKSYFGEISKGPDVLKKEWPLPFFEGPRVKVIKTDFSQPSVFINFPYPPMGSRDSYALDLAAQIIGSGKSSRLYQILVKEKQVAQSIDISPWSMELNSHLVLMVRGASGISAEKLAEEVKDVLYHCKENPFNWRETKKAKNFLKIYMTRFLDTNQGKNFLFGIFELLYEKPELITTEVNKYDDIQTEEVDAAVKKYLVPKNSNTLIYKPEK